MSGRSIRAGRICASTRRGRCASCSTTSGSTTFACRRWAARRCSGRRCSPRRGAGAGWAERAMRVLLDTTFARRGPSGTGVYLTRLAPALRALGVEVIQAANERRGAPGGGTAQSLRNLAADSWWTRVELARLARECGADVLHHPLPAHAPSAPCPQVVTVHDLAF